jgi:hypothetical protein
MNLHHPLRSSVRIWLAISIPLFIAGWFIRGGKGGDEPIWEIWSVLIRHDYICSLGEMLDGLAAYTIFLAILAALVGWLLQFAVCAALDYFHRDKARNENHVA